jgi:glutathione synthase/RimK-type ligase-like ATP-grasp enzyme
MTKIDEFMSSLNLKCGSLDLIYSTNDELYFLEVNPNGQYDWVSYFGNFNLTKNIAEILINENFKNK